MSGNVNFRALNCYIDFANLNQMSLNLMDILERAWHES